MMTLSPTDAVIVAAIGLVGGTLGGLLGLGGSVFIIPTLTLLFGVNQHLYQASALIANIFVAAAATMRHRGRGTIRPDILPSLAIGSALAALVGVGVSNLMSPLPLAALFGAFLVYASASELLGLGRGTKDNQTPAVGGPRLLLGSSIGAIGGFASGLLGIGGGAVMVPLLRKFGGLPVRQAVATSAGAMIVACCIGATAKNLSIASLQDASGAPLTLRDSLFLAAVLTPFATIGGSIGASLVYNLPISVIRVVLSILLAFAGARMMLSGGPSVIESIRSLGH